MRAALAGATVSLLLGACATPGAAGTNVASLEAPPAANSGEQTKKICKSIAVIGSNLPQRVCSTQQEWDAVEAQQVEAAKEFDRARRSATGQGALDGAN